MKTRIVMTKEAFNKKNKNLFCCSTDLEMRKRLVKREKDRNEAFEI